MSQINHPQLGRVTGTSQDGIACFRGIKYASLEHAFAAPKVHSKCAADGLDATRHGPSATSPVAGCDMELGLIQRSLPHGPFTTSATECLSLNIAVPEKAEGQLPVFVFIHGGGFATGSNAWPQYDLVRIVKLSQDIGKPVVGVQMNYRLGVYGFLASTTLREAGIKPNRGLLDQKAAFEWIHENIAGFQGNPDLVTAIGQSAGSDVLKRIEVDVSQSPAEQLKQLLAAPDELILSRVGPDVKLCLVIDGELISSRLSYAQWGHRCVESVVPGTKWCRRVLIGDCQNDANIMRFALLARKAGIASAFNKVMASHLPSTSTNGDNPLQALLEAYRISTERSDDEALTNILQLMNDALFCAPVYTIAQAFPRESFIYHFNEPNPWDGPSGGEAGHILDIAFLFQNFNEYLDSNQEESAKAFGRDIITFVNGEEPFPAHDAQAGGAKVYGLPSNSGGGFVKSKNPADYGRRSVIWQLAPVFGWDKLAFALTMFLVGQ